MPHEEWITVPEAAKISGYSESHLRYLLREGKLNGRKVGRDWVTTRQAIEEYVARKPRPGPKPREDDST